MNTIITIIFLLGYIAIALEHPIKINKTATALITGILCWVVFALGSHDIEHIKEDLPKHLASTSEILFFLLGAMTIVELIEAHEGFSLITDRITTTKISKLLWIIGFVTFFLAAMIDILAASLVVLAMLKRLVPNIQQRKLFAGFVVIAANAGGAWSPIGAITTTMLWIGGQVSAFNVAASLFIPSLVALVVTILYFSYIPKELKGDLQIDNPKTYNSEKPHGNVLILVLGILGLISVPIFKTITHLPPYMGMMLVLGIIWVVSEIINPKIDDKLYNLPNALSRIDNSTILFFLGILIAVGALESSGILGGFSLSLNQTVGNENLIVVLIGLSSSIVDNVPLVAATQGMYEISKYPMDVSFWHFLAYCAGVGGSILIIGSAAGVAVMGAMGKEAERTGNKDFKISFAWYARNMSLPALLGYFLGVASFLLLK
jgi:Na+/H+ antiporter NhaD/arsenite permease-like protein